MIIAVYRPERGHEPARTQGRQVVSRRRSASRDKGAARGRPANTWRMRHEDLQFEFERGGVLEARVLEDKAPETARAVAAAAPISATVYQARWSGKEIFVPLDIATKPPRENQTIRAGIGDVIYFREWEGSYQRTGFEAIGLFYGNEIVREWRGDAPVNVIGRIDPSEFELLEIDRRPRLAQRRRGDRDTGRDVTMVR